MWEKQPLGFLNISETLPEYQQKNYISGIFWAFKSKLQIIHAATYIALFLPDSYNCFFKCLVLYVHICLYYFLILCFYFHLLFHALLTTRHILQFTLLDSISLQPVRNITEIKKHHSPLQLAVHWRKIASSQQIIVKKINSSSVDTSLELKNTCLSLKTISYFLR